MPEPRVSAPGADAPGFPSRTLTREISAAARLADCRGKRIGILIVAYNAVTTLTQVLKRIQPVVWDNVEEVVVFDDASQDSTYELAVGYKVLSETTKLHVIKNARNLGYGGNQKAGYRYFMERGFDVVVLLHGDGQYAPEVLSNLYHPIVADECDAVLGSRMLPDYGGPRKGGMPLYKYIGNRILTFFENRMLSMDLTEFHSGYRAYSLAALRQIDFSRMTDNFHFDTEIIIKLHHQGYRIREVPIPTYYGKEICYVNGMKYAFDVIKAVYRYDRTRRCIKAFPEFREYLVHYPIKQSRYSSHDFARSFVGTGQNVLDCGCGEGFFAAELIAQGNCVVGVDTLPEPKLCTAFGRYIRADLRRGLTDAFPELGGMKFSRILLMDILEHLETPAVLLEHCKRLLTVDGLVFVSVPNIANITVRLMLLFGRFEYTQRGILDRTHLRFFTRRSARRLIKENGYRIVREDSTLLPIELILGTTSKYFWLTALNRILRFATRLHPGLLGYQHVFVITAPASDCHADQASGKAL